MKRIWISCLAVIIVSMTLAQDKLAIKYAKTITQKDLETRLAVLASDEMEGRETGMKGQKLAAEYIAAQFKSFGLDAPVDGSYFQEFNLAQRGVNEIYLKKSDDRLEAFKDFLYYSTAETFGDEYIEIELAGMRDSYEGKYVAMTVDEVGDWYERVERFMQMKAKGIVIVLKNDREFESVMARMGPALQQSDLKLSNAFDEEQKAPRILFVNRKVMAWAYGRPFPDIKPGHKTQLILNADYLKRPIGTENVLGFLKGTEKPEEVVVITSHYDHVGIINGKIHNGADDDGSGTTTVLELAQAFTEAAANGHGPKRSILFMTVTGEEKGLLGSDYYTQNPIFPLDQTVANLNIDMVGRVDPKHEKKPNYVYLIGSDKLSRELHDVSESMNETYTQLTLDYTYNDENDPNRFYYRSDHYNFARHGIPIIFYFNGTHADYHRPTDTIEKINFEVMQKRAQLVFHTAWAIANRDNRVKVD